MRIWGFCAGIFGIAGIGGGAVAAHVLKDPHAVHMIETAALYALIHAAVLAGWDGYGKSGNLAKLAMSLGVLFFSGSIAAKYLLLYSTIGDLAPVGGVLMMVGWGLLIIETMSHKRT